MDYTGDIKINITPETLVIIEGAYCLRPELRDLYDYKIFMDITPDKQARRIKKRNGEDIYKIFAEKWIPLEERYINMLGVKSCCDLIINN